MVEKKNLSVVMLPFPAFGHMIPFFHLSVAMARCGVHVSYVSTPRNIQRLPKLPADVSSDLIDLVSLPKPKFDNNLLPGDAEATVDIPFEKIQYLKVSYDLLRQPFKDFVTKASPDWVIIDFLSHWAVGVARECNTHVANFSAFSAVSNVFVGPPEFLAGDGLKRLRPTPESLTVPPPWVDFPSTVALRGYESLGFHMGFYGKNASGISDAERIATVIRGCEVMAIRSCPEFEGSYLDSWQKLIQRPVVPVGVLPPPIPLPTTTTLISEETVEEEKSSFQWLDMQKPKSVVFVGFGSECKLSKEQVYEIAKGLELSNLPFLWALRKPLWALHHKDEALPNGFLERTSSIGVLCWGWVPQMEILAHPSVGGSLFHSGWGSAIETLQFGHCLVLLPFMGDQVLNARFLVEKGVAVEVERNDEDGSFTGTSIAHALRFAMEGRELRDKAAEAAKIFKDEKMHCDYVGKFVEYLMSVAVRK